MKMTLMERLTWPKQETDIAMMQDDLRVIVPTRTPEPVAASVALERNLARAIDAYDAREAELVNAIATRGAELADIRRARTAAHAARLALGEADVIEAAEGALADALLTSTLTVRGTDDPNRFDVIGGDSEFNRMMKGGRQ